MLIISVHSKKERREKVMAKYRLPIDKSQAASSMGVNLGPDTSARQNGSVGGYMVKKTFESLGMR
jgi:hypothetical protein